MCVGAAVVARVVMRDGIIVRQQQSHGSHAICCMFEQCICICVSECVMQ